jgi:hypothetical protein
MRYFYTLLAMEYPPRKPKGRAVVRGTYYSVPKAKTKRGTNPGGWKYSNFFVTIQTNYKPKGQYDFHKVHDAFKNLLKEEVFDASLDKFIVFHKSGIGDSYDTDTFAEPISETNIELGKNRRGGRLHSHSILTLHHKSNIQLDGNAIRDFVNLHMAPYGVKGSFVVVKYIPATMHYLLEYVRKDQNEKLSMDELEDAFQKLNVN